MMLTGCAHYVADHPHLAHLPKVLAPRLGLCNGLCGAPNHLFDGQDKQESWVAHDSISQCWKPPARGNPSTLKVTTIIGWRSYIGQGEERRGGDAMPRHRMPFSSVCMPRTTLKAGRIRDTWTVHPGRVWQRERATAAARLLTWLLLEGPPASHPAG